MQSTTLKSRPAQAPAAPWRNVLPVHPAAELLPRIPDLESRELGEDIKCRGLQTPIAILVGDDGVERLLDGISRLDAMEMVGLPIVTDGELNRDIVATQNVQGNVDPYAYVLSANIRRRHLTREQQTELIEKLLKLNPNQSNLAIARQLKKDDKTVAKVRSALERRSEIPNVKTRTDSKGREQPAKKQKPPARAPVDMKPAKPAAKAPEVEQEKKPTKQPPEDSLATRIENIFGGVLTIFSDESIWPSLNAGRKKRLQKALKQLKGAYRELIELASPAPRRGRPPKGRAS